MNEVTRLLKTIDQDNPHAAEQLLPLIYTELRRLARDRLQHENPGQTLQATALVHEAYLRLVGQEQAPHWNSQGHFFAAAAEAMRRILVERARGKKRLKRGGQARRLDLDERLTIDEQPQPDLVALDEALSEFEQHDPQAAQLVKLRYFAGLTHQQAAESLGITRRAADRLWTLARAWLYRRMTEP